MERQAKDGTVYQQVGEDFWQPVTRQAKDGTVYKKVGSDDWTPMEASQPVENEPKNEVRDDVLGIPISTIEGALDALPFAGALAGGTVGMAAGPLGSVGGAGLGAAGGKALGTAIRAGLGLESAPQTRAELYGDPLKEGLMGAAGEGAGQALAKVPGLIRKTPQAIEAAKRFVKGQPQIPDEIVPRVSFEDIGFQPTLKPNAGEIKSAAERIGGKATPGMVSSNPNIQNLESVIAQSPTVSGERIRKAYDPLTRGLKEASENLAGRPNLSPFEAGEQFKTGLTTKIKSKVAPLSTKFDSIRESAKYVKPEPASLNRAADRLLKQDLAEFANLPQGQAISKYAEMIRGAKTLDSLKQLRSSVGDEIGKALDSGDGQLAMALGKVKNSIQRVERREILKTAINNAREIVPSRSEGGKFLSKAAKEQAAQKLGTEVAKDLIGEIKTVNKGWRALMGELETIAQAGGIKKIASPKHLARIIDDMPSEKISERFFNTKNYQGLRDVKTYLPEEFDILRQNKLGQIAEKSLTKGEPDPTKLVRNLKGIGKEARELLFGKDGEKVLRDIETVVNAMPAKVGASDTPRGLSWFTRFLKPTEWANEANSAYNYMLLSGKIVKNSSSQKMPSNLPRAAGYGAVGVLSNQNSKGENKWASNGLLKLNAHAGYEALDPEFDVSSARPKLKRLLIQASDLRPGSKAMSNIMLQIEKEFGGKN